MKLRIISFVMILSMFGCYVPSQKMLNLSVKKQESFWLNGKELVKLIEDDLEIIVNFDRTKHGISSFDLSIFNKSDDPILISPAEFYCITNNRINEIRKFYAIDPEIALRDFDSKIERKYAEIKSDKRSELVFSFFDLVSSYTNKTDEEKKISRVKSEERQETYVANQAKNIDTLNSLNTKRDELSVQALRKTTLLPMQKLSGKIYIKTPIKITSLDLYLPIDGRKIKVEYENIR